MKRQTGYFLLAILFISHTAIAQMSAGAHLYDYKHQWESMDAALVDSNKYIIMYTLNDIYAKDSSAYDQSGLIELNNSGDIIHKILAGRNKTYYMAGNIALVKSYNNSFTITGTIIDSSYQLKGMIINIDNQLKRAALIRLDSIYDNNAVFSSISTLADSGYIISGQRNYNLFAVRLDSTFHVKWAKEFAVKEGTYGNYAYQTADGGFVLSGTKTDLNQVSNSHDFYLIRTDSSGKVLWSKIWLRGVNNGGAAIPLLDGNILFYGLTMPEVNLCNSYMAEFDQSGKMLWEVIDSQYRFLAFQYMMQLPDSRLLACEALDYGNTAGLCMMTSKGKIIWERRYKYSPHQDNYVFHVTTDVDGGYILTGFTRDTLADGSDRRDQDAWLLKVDSLGYSHSVDYTNIHDVFYYNDHLLGDAYPNPASDVLTIPYALPDEESNALLRITDMMGRTLHTENLKEKSGQVRLSLDGYTPGIYFYSMAFSSGAVITKKFVVE